MSEHIIDIQKVSKAFGTKKVLNDLSLSVPQGSVFGLLGKNGAGKTTLIKCILGLMHPGGGQINTLGDVPAKFKEETKEKLGYVPQSDVIYPWLKVYQLIDYTASFYKKWNSSLVDRLVKEWELDPQEKVGLLSEGQLQKLLIILSLGHEPELLIFDEPVASLDPAARRIFLKTILEIVANRECTVFFSTHITSDLERVADRVAILKEGRIEFCGELDTLKDEVKRLHVTSSDLLAKRCDIEGVLNYEEIRNEAILTVRSFSPEFKKHLEKQWNAKIEVHDLNLEEIFLELTR